MMATPKRTEKGTEKAAEAEIDRKEARGHAAVKERKLAPEKLFLRIGLLFGLLVLFIMPILAPPDEGNHFSHAYIIFHQTDNEVVNQPSILAQMVKIDYQKSYENHTFLTDFFKEKSYLAKNMHVGLNLTTYYLQWLPQAIGILIGSLIYPSLGVMILFGRLTNLLFYLIILYFAIKKAKFGKLPMTIIGLLPISIQQAASLSYDTLYYVALFVCFSLLTNLWVRKEKLTLRWYIYILLSIGLLFFDASKQNVLLFGLYFLTLPVALFGNNLFTRFVSGFWKLCQKFKYFVAFFILALFFAGTAYLFRHQPQNLMKGLQVAFNTLFRADLNKDLDPILTTGMVGNFANLTYLFPEWLVIVNFILLVLAFLNEKKVELDQRVAVFSGLLYVANILGVIFSMYLTWTIGHLALSGSLVSVGSQGRYFTPFLLTLIPLAVGSKFLKNAKFDFPPKKMYHMTQAVMIFNLAFFLFLTLLVYYTKNQGQAFFLKF